MSKKKNKNVVLIDLINATIAPADVSSVLSVEPADVSSVPSVETSHVVTTSMKTLFEKLKKTFFLQVFLTCLNGVNVDLGRAYEVTLRYIVSQFTFDVSKVYVVSRKSFLNTFCKLYEVSPTLSKKSNKNENATLSVYGDVVGMFNNIFDVDKMYIKSCFVTYQCIAIENINAVYCNEKIFIMSHDKFTALINGDLLNDTVCVVIDIDQSEVKLNEVRDVLKVKSGDLIVDVPNENEIKILDNELDIKESDVVTS